MDEKRIIEVAGVKMEVDLRYAKTIDTFKIGQAIKVLIKEYGDSYMTYPGVIVGFDNFVQRPCIVIAYAKGGYDPDIKFVCLTKDSKDIEMVPMIDDEMRFTKQEGVKWFDLQINAKNQEIERLEDKKKYFEQRFGEFFKL